MSECILSKTIIKEKITKKSGGKHEMRRRRAGERKNNGNNYDSNKGMKKFSISIYKGLS
jgi:hypothetical protein